MKKLEELSFNNTYAHLGDAFSSRVMPTAAPDPYLVAFNPDAAALIDLDPSEAQRPEFLEYFSGARSFAGAEPVAMVYAGHQFGSRVPRLGDGRAILLGEVPSPRGKWDLHLKGSGQTPYSRQGDGRAVLRSSIREYLCGEAMHALGISTTRTLCIVGSDETVFRETPETRAMIVRMAPSHVRFGSFEYFYFHHHSDPEMQRQRLRELADYVIAQHYPEFTGLGEARYAAWLREVSVRTAHMIAQWQSVGFAHGVMNTDNMSILGLTLDYGPFGFMEKFDPHFICNHSDHTGRYAFSQQPYIGLWNLHVLAQVLVPLIGEETAFDAIKSYEPAYHARMMALYAAKLGLSGGEQPGDPEFITRLLQLMQKAAVDYTGFFRALGDAGTAAGDARMLEFFAGPEVRELWDVWKSTYQARLQVAGAPDHRQRMNRVNPKYVLRNHLAQRAIEDAERGNFSEIEKLRVLLSRPFEEHPDLASYAEPSTDRGAQVVVSCSS